MNPSGAGGGLAGSLGMQLTPWVKRLMIATGVLSIVGGLSLAWMGSRVPYWFLLQPMAIWGQGSELPGVPALWQLFTYPFFVLDPINLLFSILMYGWFAGAMESRWGSRRFLTFAAMISLGAGGGATLLALVWPALAESTIAGPFPLLEGLIIAWGLTFPDREIRLFFVLPVKGIHLVYLTLGMVALFIIFTGTFVPFVPQLIGMAIAGAIVTGVWKPKRMMLHVKKKQVEWELRRERDKRKRRVADATHLKPIDGGDEGDDPPKNGNGAPGGWLH